MEMDILAFLQFILFGGGSVIAVSFISERLVWFQSLDSGKKKWYQFFASTVLSIGAYLIVTYVPVEILLALQPLFTIIGGNFSFYYIGQVFHKADKDVSK